MATYIYITDIIKTVHEDYTVVIDAKAAHLITCKILFTRVNIELSKRNTAWHHTWTHMEKRSYN